MARYDKYDPISGGFRAPLAQAIVEDLVTPANNQVGIPLAVGLNATGMLVVGGGDTGVIGVYVADQAKVIGDIADVMTSGEIVDLDEDVFNPGGTAYGAEADGEVTVAAPGSGLTSGTVGFVVGDKSLTTGVTRSRLVVRVNGVTTTGA